MKLSVVIPVYNGADFIEKSYHSIIDQDVDDFELIYVNNNSTDNSVNQIKHYVMHDSRVIFIQQPKQGAAAARNLGIQAAKGEYIYVFDVDDEIFPNALKRMIAILDTHADVFAVFGKMVKSHTGIKETAIPDDETGSVIIKEAPYWGLQWFSSLKTVVGPPAFLYRKSVFNVIGFYNESIQNNEDTALDIKLGMTQRVAFLDSYVYLYFKHSDSTIEQTKRIMPRAFMVWPRLVKEHLPFYLQYETPKEFDTLLFEQLYTVMGKQVYFTKGFSKRKFIKKDLLNQVSAIEVPFLIRFFLAIMVLFPFSYVIKFYVYYLVPYIVKK